MKKRVLVTIFLFIFFVILSFLVLNDATTKFDLAFYNLIKPIINDTNTKIFKVITFFGSVKFIVVSLILMLIFWKNNRGGAKITLIVIISTIINNLLKIIIRRPRPEVLTLVEEGTFSYPSGHTMAIATLVGFIIYSVFKNDKLSKQNQILVSIFLCIGASLVMFSRIYLGAHYLTDIIGGITASLIIVCLTTLLIDVKNW